MVWPGGKRWAIEIKRSLSPKLERRFHSACADVQPVRRIVIHPGTHRHPIAPDVEAMSLRDILAELAPTKTRRPR